jgi:hypothetical protein
MARTFLEHRICPAGELACNCPSGSFPGPTEALSLSVNTEEDDKLKERLTQLAHEKREAALWLSPARDSTAPGGSDREPRLARR